MPKDFSPRAESHRPEPAYLFYNFALRRVPVGRISLMYPLTGPIGATSAWLVLDAEITIKIFISLGIILVGTIIPYVNKK